MKKRNFPKFLVLFLLMNISFTISADTREEPISFFLVLDKSLSMVEEIDSVKEYVNDSIIDGFLIEDDYFMLIQFYGKAETLIKTRIESSGTREELKRTISRILADGRFTDIGNALDSLGNAVEDYPDDGRRTYLILVTDGIQEAPPSSSYYSPDGSFNHAFLEHTKTIQKKGWKIQILGIGSETAAEEVARELSGGYVEIPDSPDTEDIERTVENLFGIIEASNLEMSPVKEDGTAFLTAVLTPSGYDEPADLTVSAVKVTLPGKKEEQILESPFTVTLVPDEEAHIEIPVRFSGVRESLEDGVEGEFVFQFSGNEVFVPAYARLTIEHAGFLSERLWLIPLAIVVLGLIVAAVFFIVRRGTSEKMLFSCTIEDGPEKTRTFALKNGTCCYISDGPAGMNISESRSGTLCAEVHADNGRLTLSVKNEKIFQPTDRVPDNVLDRSLKILKENGTYCHIAFNRIKKDT